MTELNRFREEAKNSEGMKTGGKQKSEIKGKTIK